MTYALGRTLEYQDMPTVRAHRARCRGRGLSVLLDRAAASSSSEQFQMRAGAGRTNPARSSERTCGRKAVSAARCCGRSRRARTCSSRRNICPAERFCAGSALRVALPLLDAMIPAGTALAQTAAAPKPQHGLHLLPARRGDGRWAPAAAGRGFELPQILEPLEPFKDQMTVVSGLRNKAAEGAGPHAVIPGTWLSCVAVLPTEAASRTAALRPTRSRRSTSARTRRSRRSSCASRRRRRAACSATGVRLRLRLDDRVPRPDPAAADGAQPAQAVLPPVRPGRHGGRARGDHRADREPARPRERERRVGARQLDATDRAKIERLSRLRARDRAPRPDDGGGRILGHRPAGRAGGRAGGFRQAHQPDVRADRARLPGGPHARRLVHDGGGNQHAAPTTRSAISDAFHPLSHHQNDPDKLERLANIQAYHSKAFARFLERWRTRRTATARCSITRSCCTAAT